MKLYTFDGAPNPRRVKLFLQYKGVDIDTESINLKKNQQFSNAYKAINSQSTVPTLVLDDGTALTDVIGICWYLESLYPEPPLFGNNATEQAAVLGWDHTVFVDGLGAVAEILRNQNAAFKNRALPGSCDFEQIPALVERGHHRIAAFFDTLENHLSGRDYMVGSGLTLADIDALVCCDFAGWVDVTVPEYCQHIYQWYQRVAKALGERNGLTV